MTSLDETQIIMFLISLLEGNDKFAARYDKKFFQQFANSQKPNVTLLTCSDSRVQSDIFGETLQNKVFVIRNIGNQVSNTIGSLDFGIQVLKTPFLLILGHTDCGVVKQAFKNMKTNIESIDREISTIRIQSKTIDKAIIENINYQVDQAVLRYQDKVGYGHLTIVGAVYDFQNRFNLGYGKMIITNINGEKKYDILRQKYKKCVKNLSLINITE